MIKIGRTKKDYREKKKKEFVELLKKYSEMEKFKFVYINGEKTNFIISSFGRLFSLNYNKSGEIKQLKVLLNNDCHLSVTVKFKSKNYNLRIHRLVATYFINNPDKKPIVHHKDGNTLNNHFSNLMWVTESEHAKLTKGLSQYDIRYGEDNPVCKYSRDQIIKVCELLVENKLTLKEISHITGVPYPTINLIRNRSNSRKFDKFGYDISKFNNFENYKYSDELIRNVCVLLEKYNETNELNLHPYTVYKNIEDATGVKFGTVAAIRCRQRRTNISKDYKF